MSAAAGALAWLIFLFIRTTDSPQTELIHKIILFAVFVVVPLALSLVATPDRHGKHPLFYRSAVFAQPFGAFACMVSFLLHPGLVAALLSSLWLAINVLTALFGISRFLQRGLHPIEESCIDAGMFYLPVAGVWLVVSRLNIQPFGFGAMIILLTVVHFHFAGFAAPVIVGMTGRVLATRTHPQRLFNILVASIIGAMPLLAAGITFSPLLALVGAILISTGLFLLAILIIGWILPTIGPLSKRVLLIITSLSSCSAMALACAYAYSIVARTVILDIPTMAMTHGLFNAFGFVTLSLLVWATIDPVTRAAPPGKP
jgi:YndJ-like protein